MKQVSISFLKKEAKLLRKNNINIKNHNESLNEISNKYGFNKWQELLDACHLNIEEKIKDEHSNISQNTPKARTIEQIPIKIASMFELLNTVFYNFKKLYLQFEKLKHRDEGHVSDYIHNIVFDSDNYSGDYNLEKKKVSALIDYIVGSYFIYNYKYSKNNKYYDNQYGEPCKLENIFMFVNNDVNNDLFFESYNYDTIKEKISLNVDEYFQLSLNSLIKPRSLNRILSTDDVFNNQHQKIYIHLKNVIKMFKIFEEIKNLTNIQTLDEAIFNWMSDYNNISRLYVFPRFTTTIQKYICEVENYDLENDIFIHEKNIENLKTEKIKVISLISRTDSYGRDYESIVNTYERMNELKMHTLIDIYSNQSILNSIFNLKAYIRELGKENEPFGFSPDDVNLYFKNLILKKPFVDILGSDFISKGTLNFYFIEK